jgi:hypothetical protein
MPHSQRPTGETPVRFEWLTPDTVSLGPLKDGVAWWRTARGTRAYPAKQDLHPRQMAALMPYLSLVKVIEDGADFEHRIVGDMIVQSFSVQLQNRRFSDIAKDAPEFIRRCFGHFRIVVETGAPVAWRSAGDYEGNAIIVTHGEVVLLPLGRGKVDHVLGFASHGPMPETA